MKPLFGRPGGKKTLLKRLLLLVPEHRIYVEPFAGSAGLLFAKPPSRFEIVNDTDLEVLNFFRVVKHRPAELAELARNECVHAERFKELRSCPPQDECHRALRFAYLTWFSFGSRQQHFQSMGPASAKSQTMAVRRDLSLVKDLFEAASARLHRVLIERRDFADCIRRWDSRHTFFYLDPPYVGTTGQKGVYESLTPERHVALAATASSSGRSTVASSSRPSLLPPPWRTPPRRAAPDAGSRLRKCVQAGLHCSSTRRQ